MRIHTVGLLGCEGLPAREHCDIAIVVPSNETGRIQECHITIGHALMELIEETMIERGQLAVQ
jgi:D-sedoheptulose 7-phosphate isomerase